MTGQLNFFESFMLSGAVNPVVLMITAAPIERVKFLIQNQDEMIKQNRLDKPYRGILDCIKRTFVSEGITPFWRGNSAMVFNYFLRWALNFAPIGSSDFELFMCLIMTYPFLFARTRLATDVKGIDGKRQYNGLIDVYKKTLATDGIAGVYRGFAISVVGDFIYIGIRFRLYNSLKPIVVGDGRSELRSALASFYLDWFVSIVSGFASYPLDTIRRRMMMTSGGAIKYNDFIDCAQQILKNEGFKSMMKGASASVLRGVTGVFVLVVCNIIYADYKRRTDKNRHTNKKTH